MRKIYPNFWILTTSEEEVSLWSGLELRFQTEQNKCRSLLTLSSKCCPKRMNRTSVRRKVQDGKQPTNPCATE